MFDNEHNYFRFSQKYDIFNFKFWKQHSYQNRILLPRIPFSRALASFLSAVKLVFSKDVRRTI